MGGALFRSNAEQVDDHMKLGQAADVHVMCRDPESEANEDCASKKSKKVVEKTTGAICCMTHERLKAITHLPYSNPGLEVPPTAESIVPWCGAACSPVKSKLGP